MKYIIDICTGIIFLCLIPTLNFAQVNNREDIKQTLTVSEVFNSIINSENEEVYITNTLIVRDRDNKTSRFPKYKKKNDSEVDSLVNSFDYIVIDKKVNFVNVGFQDQLLFSKIIFKKQFYYEWISHFNEPKWKLCEFNGGVAAHEIAAYGFRFEDCKFKYFHCEDIDARFIQFKDCEFRGLSLIDTEKAEKSFLTCKLIGKQSLLLTQWSSLGFYHCDFLFDITRPKESINEQRLVFHDGNNLNSLVFHNCNFEIPIVFENSSVQEVFVLDDCKISSYLDMHRLNLPESNSDIRWNQISNQKLRVYDRFEYFDSRQKFNDENENAYYQLLKSYAQLQRIYKNNGDRISFNESYIERRNLETRRSKHDFISNPSFNGFFEWELNEFLRVFCKYGTSPTRALVLSFFIIIGFSIIYFFFPSGKNRIKIRPLIQGLFNNQEHSSQKFLFKKLLSQIADSFATSVNAFITLGYGHMPVYGIAKYVAVLEGLLGWFLLSIFSVSLISQILQ